MALALSAKAIFSLSVFLYLCALVIIQFKVKNPKLRPL